MGLPMQLITYDSPALNVLTADNLQVWINASVTFQLKEGIDIQEFNSSFLASGGGVIVDRLKTLMAEAVRTLAVAQNHRDVYDIQGRDCEEQREELEDKLDKDMIEVKSFIIQEVQLPREFWGRMQEDVMIKVRTQVEQKDEEERLTRQHNQDDVQMMAQQAKVKQEAAQKEAETTKASIEIATSAISSETSKIVSKMKASRDRTVAEKLNSAELIEADLKAQADAVKREVQTKLQAALNNITAEGKEFQVEKETQLASQVATDKATSAELVGKSEAAGSESQAKERKFEEDKAQLDVFAKLVENKKLRIASSAEVARVALPST